MSSLKYRTTNGWEELSFLTLDDVYPVGALYLSYVNTSPASLFGGTWTQLTDRFLVGAGSDYAVGATGGESTVTLTVAQMPSHTHEVHGWKRSAVKGSSAAASVDAYGNGAAVSYNRITTDEPTGVSGGCVTPVLNTGSSSAHENKPPYLAVYMWRRTA